MDFLKKNWICIAIGLALLYFLYNSQQRVDELLEKNKQIEIENNELLKKIEASKKKIDTLYLKDTVYIEKIKYIKKETDDKVKSVDTLSISDVQSFFSERYPAE